jgi:hypothetical protein
MFNVMIRTELLYRNALIMGLLFMAFCVLPALGWNAIRGSRRLRRIALVVMAVAIPSFSL